MKYPKDRATLHLVKGITPIHLRQPVVTPPVWRPPKPEPACPPYAPPSREPEILPDNVEPHGPEHDPDDDPFNPGPSRGRTLLGSLKRSQTLTLDQPKVKY